MHDNGKTLYEPLALIISVSDQMDLQFSTLRVLMPDVHCSIGRNPDNDLCLKNIWVSRRHCTIYVRREKLLLVDHQSTNGTYLNGSRITGTVRLPLPCWISVAYTALVILPADDIMSFFTRKAILGNKPLVA